MYQNKLTYAHAEQHLYVPVLLVWLLVIICAPLNLTCVTPGRVARRPMTQLQSL